MDKRIDDSLNLSSQNREIDALSGVDEFAPILLLEDDAARASRRSEDPALLRVRLHLIPAHACVSGTALPQMLGNSLYLTQSAAPKKSDTNTSSRVQTALAMIDSIARPQNAIVVANAAYGCRADFLKGIVQRAFDFVVELLPSTLVTPLTLPDNITSKNLRLRADHLIGDSLWKVTKVEHPCTKHLLCYAMTDLGRVRLKRTSMLEDGNRVMEGRLFALREGAIDGATTRFVFSSLDASDSAQLIRYVGWTRWIKPLVRNRRITRIVQAQADEVSASSTDEKVLEAESCAQEVTLRHRNRVKLRLNIALTKQQDEATPWKKASGETHLQRLAQETSTLNVAELFAGAGGMGLGFLMAAHPQARYRVLFSGEVHPIYAETLRRNHTLFSLAAGVSRGDVTPEEVRACDLSQPHVLDSVVESVGSQELHLLIGGPPCQGFSCANRNTGHSGNPSNRLVEVFLRYVERLQPRVFLMENVQGILWTPKNGEEGSPMVVDDLARRMECAGYLVFPKLLDAAWFGVPQHRSRFFLLGIHRDLGYRADDFGEWGPFPHPTHGPGTGQPYVTVGEAFGGLPPIKNGHALAEMNCRTLNTQVGSSDFLRAMRAGAPAQVISDHVTSKHQSYVLDRYAKIPQGGNWENIRDEMTNYADVKRTHSNIYRRLRLDEPSITLGHYRKAMTIHPTQDRGLSLREAARLQSFPDWFRFVGTLGQSQHAGLSHKQQQLANAVCPLMLKAIAEYLVTL